MHTRPLLAIGVVAPLLFVVALLIEGFARPGYSSWRDMGSVLSVGPGGWQQIVNFIVCGLLIMVSAAGLARAYPATAWGPRLVAIFGLSLVIAGAFSTDPASGYPPRLAPRWRPADLARRHSWRQCGPGLRVHMPRRSHLWPGLCP